MDNKEVVLSERNWNTRAWRGLSATACHVTGLGEPWTV